MTHYVIDSRGNIPRIVMSGSKGDCDALLTKIPTTDIRRPHFWVLDHFEYITTLLAMIDIEQLETSQIKQLSGYVDSIQNECVVTLNQRKEGNSN